MKVDAVRSLSLVNNYNFGANEKTGNDSKIDNRRNSSMMTKVPVIVMLAMNPATLNSAVPMISDSDSQIVVMADPESNNDKSEYPYGWKSLSRYRIQKELHGQSPLFKYDMLFATSSLANGDYSKITDVFLIMDFDNPSNKPYCPPPKIEALYHHVPLDAPDFYGVKVAATISDFDGEKKGFMRAEYKIDRQTAEALIELISKKSKWRDYTDIEYIETISSKVLPFKKY